MTLLSVLLALCHLAGAESAPAVSALTVVAGPWQSVDERGLTTIAVRLVPLSDQSALRAVKPVLGKVTLPVSPVIRVLPPAAGPLAGQVIAAWTLPLLTTGRVALGSDPRAMQLDLPIPPASNEAVRLVIAGGQSWPTAAELTAIAEPLGGPPSLVVVVGQVAASRIGTGGWESAIPVILRLAPGASDPVTSAIVGDVPAPDADLTWGLLGLPSMVRGPDVAIDCAARPRPWNVLLDPEARWDLGLRARPERSDIQALRTPVGIARLLGVPLILSGGSAAGFISEPLTTIDTGLLHAAAGGVRYVAATPAGDGVRCLPPLAAMAIEEPRLVGLSADDRELRLIIGADLALRWGVGSDGSSDAQSLGWGGGDGAKLTEAYRDGRKATPPAAIPEALIWVPRVQLALGEWNLLELFELANPEGGQPSLPAQRLARRLVAEPMFIGDELALLQKLPPWLQHEAILRWMAVDDQTVTAWVRLAALSLDSQLVRALLAQVEHDHSPQILAVLMQRLQAQAAGSLAVDEDPMIQSRLASAVFDAPTLSPTPLRPIARTLLPKLSPLGAKPVQRFLDRVGMYRPGQ